MKKERLKVLELIEEGKITVEDATKLLEAMALSGSYESYDYEEGLEEKLHNFSKSINNFAKDVGDKLNTTYKDVEPKLKNVTRSLVEKTANVAEEISRALRENLKAKDEKDEKEHTDGAPDNSSDASN
ncbi:MAG: hypothetical protein LBL35_05575 [Clostridiales bacterium]|jgi:polyhydroxyalkanoate synthesis regulator phasin|nr:hypothetical protein [Clostridiales bacterium]